VSTLVEEAYIGTLAVSAYLSKACTGSQVTSVPTASLFRGYPCLAEEIQTETNFRGNRLISRSLAVPAHNSLLTFPGCEVEFCVRLPAIVPGSSCIFICLSVECGQRIPNPSPNYLNLTWYGSRHTRYEA